MISQVLRTLNRLINEGHASTLAKLINQRVSCTEKLGDDPHVQVRQTKTELQVGILGILNGILSEYGSGFCIHAVYDDQDQLVRFEEHECEEANATLKE